MYYMGSVELTDQFYMTDVLLAETIGQTMLVETEDLGVILD
jgi:hypothetical protein